MDTIKISLPLKSEYLTAVRLTTGGVCATAGFDVESTEDVKVCVTEALLILKRNGFLAASAEFSIGESLGVRIRGDILGGEKEEGAEGEISFALLDALIGGVKFVSDDEGVVRGISFEA